MSDFKGTKGAWFVNVCQKGHTENIEIKKSNHIVAVTKETGKVIAITGRLSCQEVIANAKLISCAPELLEALTEMVKIFDKESSELEQGNAIHYAKEIIKKATTL